MTISTAAGPRIIGGRYDVERQLGSGATATVYLCRDRQMTGHVAVKVLHLDLAESVGAERFLREIRLTQGLDHPSIVPVIDSGADGSVLYCVLPYMEGGTLRDLMREKKQLPIGEAIDIGRTLALAVAYAHEKGLIHRDIKPENILFSQGKAFLGDFGIARVLHATAGDVPQTTTGVIRGTPAYMSPEQASGERNYDGRSDIYSLGCVLYEMISGMPPFVGPTSQSVLAQRFSTTPRPMRTYRSSVSPALERVIEKAMAYTPADRFDTAREFAHALQIAHEAPVRRRLDRKSLVVAIGVVMLAVVVYAVGKADINRQTSGVSADTTQIVVLPFERNGETKPLGSVDAMLYDAFSAWQGVSVVEPFRVRDAMNRETAAGVGRDRVVALSLGAGRFIRGEISVLPAGGGWRIQAWLHQVGRRDTTLHYAAATIAPTDLAAVHRVYARLANALLLRGRDSALTVSSSSLPSVQAFAAGMDSLGEWNLTGADRAFQNALELDKGFANARFWQAQVRAWRRRPMEEWRSLANQAAADSSRLPRRERRLAEALTALGSGNFDEACTVYRRLITSNPTDFAAWYGLGQCRDLDYQLVREAEGTLRYRASYQEAMRAYRQAFSVLAVSHRGMQGGAFEPLRDLLFMKASQLRQAVSPSGRTDEFVGRLDRDGDTLVMRVIPVALLATGGPAAVPEHLADAIDLQRDLFRQIVAAWSTALPGNSAAKEGVAISLEMRGDRSALDTLRVARQLADDEATRLRLAAAEVILMLKHLDARDDQGARAVRSLADSLLERRGEPTADEALALAPLAVLTGRCELASALVEQSPTAPDRRLPIDLNGQSEALTMRRAMGCPERNPSITALRDRIAALVGRNSPLVPSLLARAAKLGWPVDTTELHIAAAGDYLARAQLAASRGQRTMVDSLFATVNQSRSRAGHSDVSPDAVYVEARTLLTVDDSIGAAEALDRFLESKSRLTPGLLARPVAIASVLRIMDLRSSLAPSGIAGQWHDRLATLWSKRDRGLALRIR